MGIDYIVIPGKGYVNRNGYWFCKDPVGQTLDEWTGDRSIVRNLIPIWGFEIEIISTKT